MERLCRLAAERSAQAQQWLRRCDSDPRNETGGLGLYAPPRVSRHTFGEHQSPSRAHRAAVADASVLTATLSSFLRVF